MANTTSANYGWVMPEVGADTDAWGTHLNATIGSTGAPLGIDAVVKAVSDTASAALPKAGGTMTGALLAAVGSLGAPSLAFFGDTDTGRYWVSANRMADVAGGTAVVDYQAATVSVNVALAVSGAATFASTLALSAGKLTTFQSAAGGAGLNLPHGAAPTSPVNGDVWSTTAAVFHRINGATRQVAYTADTLLAANNLSELSGTAATARGNLGLGSAATLASSAVLQAANNLNDVGSAASARSNLGLGSIATAASGAYAAVANNLSELTATASTARGNLGLGGAATLSVGTTTGTVAAGDDSRITGAAQKSQNLSDLTNAATARTNLGLGTAATQNTGTSGANVPLANGNNTWDGTGTHNGVETFNARVAAAAGVDLTGVLASMTTTEAGYMGMPVNSQAGDYSLTAADRGRMVFVTATGKTVTIPANASVTFPIGTVIAISADAACAITIAISSDTLRLVPTNSTGSRSLAGPGTAYLSKMKSTEWWIRGDVT